MLKIWGRRSSANVQKVMWLVGELKLPHEHTQAGGPYGVVNDAKFRAMNPNGLVPVIEDDGLVLWESNAITRYLASRYGRPRFWPDDPRQCALADQWMDWSATTFQPNFIGLFWGYFRTPEKDRNWDAIKTFQQKVAANLTLLDTILAKHRYVVNDEFSIGDIPNAVHLYRYYTLGLDVAKLIHVEAWYERIKARSAYAEHVMVSYEELRGKLTF